MTASQDHCECRVCSWTGTLDELTPHLEDEHGMDKPAREKLTVRLHAAKDTSEYSENTLGFYEGQRLVCIMVQRRVRPADDPMRF